MEMMGRGVFLLGLEVLDGEVVLDERKRALFEAAITVCAHLRNEGVTWI